MNDASELLSAYFQLMNINGAAHLYREAVRCGALAALDSGPQTAAEVATTCGTATRPTELVLEGLESLALVSKSGPAYRLTPLASMLLAGSYRNLGDEYWAHLPALLRIGEPLLRMDDTSRNEAHYQAQAAMLGWMLTPAAQCAAKLLANSVPAKAMILDLGAGSGIWSLTLASLVLDATITAVDRPGVLEVAAETAKNLGLSDRLRTIAGDFHEVELPVNWFDLAIIANVTHLLTPEANGALLNKARRALQPESCLAIIDVFSGQPQGDLNRTLYALGLALRTEHGHVYTRPELEPLLRDAGFGEPRFLPLRVPPFIMGMLLVPVL